MRVDLQQRLAALASLAAPPRRTVRLRLTLLYGGLFVASGAALLAVTYLLVRHFTAGVVSTHAYLKPSTGLNNPLPKLPALTQLQTQDLARQHASDLHQLLVWSGIALALMAVVSIGLGWLVAGRVLRPLRTMTATTRRISEANLHQRLAVKGPADELKELGDTIDGLLVRLEAAFDAQRWFVANASHELRTPLAMMRTSLDVATGKRGPVPPQLTELDRKLREGLDHADRLLESFLTLARAQHGALADEASVSIDEVVTAAIHARSTEIAEKRIDVQQELRRARVSGSATLLARMVENVIDNAIHHNEPDGWIRIEADEAAGLARLTIESGGAPLEENEVGALAQPFTRLGTERTDSQNGFGLGLSIVAAIAAAHGGKLELHARPEGGLRVVIELPHAARTVKTGTYA
jgi:signal transduction histidine kinase